MRSFTLRRASSIYSLVTFPLSGRLFLKGCCDYPECRQGNDEAYDFRIVVDESDERCVLFRGTRFEAHAYDLVQSVFSRNSGLIESDMMASKAVASSAVDR